MMCAPAEADVFDGGSPRPDRAWQCDQLRSNQPHAHSLSRAAPRGASAARDPDAMVGAGARGRLGAGGRTGDQRPRFDPSMTRE